MFDEAAVVQGHSPLRPARPSPDSVAVEMMWVRVPADDVLLNGAAWQGDRRNGRRPRPCGASWPPTAFASASFMAACRTRWPGRSIAPAWPSRRMTERHEGGGRHERQNRFDNRADRPRPAKAASSPRAVGNSGLGRLSIHAAAHGQRPRAGRANIPGRPGHLRPPRRSAARSFRVVRADARAALWPAEAAFHQRRRRNSCGRRCATARCTTACG